MVATVPPKMVSGMIRPLQTLGGVVNPVEDLAGSLQLAMDSGGKRVLLPMASASDIPTVPAEIFSKFQISFYADPVDAVYKALGVQ